MTLRRSIPVFLIFAASIALGVFYNSYLPEYFYPYGGNVALPKFIAGILAVVALFLLVVMLYYLLAHTFRVQKMKLFLILTCMGVAACILLAIGDGFLGRNYKNALIVLLVYPFAFLGIIPQFYKKDGQAYVSIIYIALMAVCLFVSNLKMALFSGVIFFASELIAIRVVRPPDIRLWNRHLIVSFMSFVSFIAALTVLYPDIVADRIRGFLNPASVPDYRTVMQWISDAKPFSFAPERLIVSDINCAAICPYSHLLTCFGSVPTVLFILLQALMVILIFRNSLKFKDTSRKILGMISSAMIGLHLTVSLGSSFILLPMIGYGAPFLTTEGIGLSLVPLLLYLTLECIEYRKSRSSPAKTFFRQIPTE